jgi:hypothetical protein
LLNLDLTGFEVRKVPQTAALAYQKQRSRRGVDALIEHIAAEGQLIEAHDLFQGRAVDLSRSEAPGLDRGQQDP